MTTAEIVSIGTELLMGEIVDTNAYYLASSLRSLGLEVRQVTQVGDDVERICEVLERSLARSTVIVTTGGLGPTADDLTREAVARVMAQELTVDRDMLASIEAYFRERGMAMPPANVKQAWVIPSATAIHNARGTAPAWWTERGGRVIVSLPGVPAEMTYLWEKEIAPRLKARFPGSVIITRTIKTFGLGEAAVGEKVQHLFGRQNPYLGIYAKPDGIHLRLIAKAATEEEARRVIAPVEAEICQALGPLVWGFDEETPEGSAGALIRERGLSLAVMESCTGGLLASTITDVPGSSDYFRGGVVSYTNEAKVSAGVDPALIEAHGAVSPQVAEAMAEAARRRLKADLGIGVTGVAGPSSLEGKPPGTVYIGLAWDGGSRVVSVRYLPQRAFVKRRATVQALLELVRLIKESANKS